MDKRKLGNSGLEVAPLAFGGNVFGWTADESTSFALLDAFVGAGFNLIDTADMYSTWVDGNKGGESETIIGMEQDHHRDDGGDPEDRECAAPRAPGEVAQWHH